MFSKFSERNDTDVVDIEGTGTDCEMFQKYFDIKVINFRL